MSDIKYKRTKKLERYKKILKGLKISKKVYK